MQPKCTGVAKVLLVASLAVLLASCLWAHPTWVKLAPTPITVNAQKTALVSNAPLVVDDGGASVQIALGNTTPESSHAFVYGTLDKGPAKAVHVQLCRAADDCIALQFAGMWDTREHYGAKYTLPRRVKWGSQFHEIRLWSDVPVKVFFVYWVSGDTG